MTGMDDLAAWLRAQIAARRELAEDAKGRSTGEWTFRDTAGGRHKVLDDLSYTISDTDEVDTNPWQTGPHIAANDPRAVLAECEAHELILTLAETVYVGYAAVRALGLAYQHADGYREEWRPQ